jgi:hypothetical protein
MHLAPKGDAVEFCRIYNLNFHIYIEDLFSLPRASPTVITQDDSVRQQEMCVIKEKKTMDLFAAFCVFTKISPIEFVLLGETGNI